MLACSSRQSHLAQAAAAQAGSGRCIAPPPHLSEGSGLEGRWDWLPIFMRAFTCRAARQGRQGGAIYEAEHVQSVCFLPAASFCTECTAASSPAVHMQVSARPVRCGAPPAHHGASADDDKGAVHVGLDPGRHCSSERSSMGGRNTQPRLGSQNTQPCPTGAAAAATCEPCSCPAGTHRPAAQPWLPPTGRAHSRRTLPCPPARRTRRDLQPLGQHVLRPLVCTAAAGGSECGVSWPIAATSHRQRSRLSIHQLCPRLLPATPAPVNLPPTTPAPVNPPNSTHRG